MSIYPTRRVSVTFSVKDGDGNVIEEIGPYSARDAAEDVRDAAKGHRRVEFIVAESSDQIFQDKRVKISTMDDVWRWALFQQDANAGVQCAICEEEIGFEQGCSSPSGSMHKGCASEHESRYPGAW